MLYMMNPSQRIDNCFWYELYTHCLLVEARESANFSESLDLNLDFISIVNTSTRLALANKPSSTAASSGVDNCPRLHGSTWCSMSASREQ